MVRVSGLVYYPVKGCAGTSVRSADVGPAGLRHDREFMVVAPDGVFRSQRRYPVMAAIRPVMLADGRLALSAPGVEDFVLEAVAEGERHRAENFRWQGEAVHQGAAAAEWFSTVLGVPSVLVRVAPDHVRITHGERAGTTWFADGHAVLVISESSLDNLNDRILERGAEPVPMDRFRPNVVVSGWREPHTEDEVREMALGGVELGYAMKCVRCTVPMVDQVTGAKAGPEPIRSLAGYRRDPEGGVVFGMKAVVTSPGQVSVGDTVMVNSWAEPSASAADPRLTAAEPV